ncbi:hypothetical protein FOXG_22628 [Fusarium oxysporum f. sp. lycopersici 4287]|uniref:Uncharacterized protein n=1 Tax=Fusarium oxysporum f. sp. lycopersici (strain 4287 / CBS 123668 / FGSC 9935 / NRRL 34936) TaxID=426428 RepID=A0A0J9WVK4_FUSO4|nr:hypothetical protein FOXG_22628 [Fusarium oxysporum f. sp. lycopersici 4287]KNB19687.1 hypothetical protein FOXG_22628 [Fusarium oxysporum f. sp. lycopersici 4287]
MFIFCLSIGPYLEKKRHYRFVITSHKMHQCCIP